MAVSCPVKEGSCTAGRTRVRPRIRHSRRARVRAVAGLRLDVEVQLELPLRVGGGAALKAAELCLQVVQACVDERDLGAEGCDSLRIPWAAGGWRGGAGGVIGGGARPAGGPLVGEHGNQPAEPAREAAEREQVTVRGAGRARWH